MNQFLNVLFFLIGFGAVAGIMIFIASYYARKLNWNYKLTMSLGAGIVFLVLALIIWAITRDLKYLLIAIFGSLLQGISMYFWLKSKKIK
jgi:ABC-type branched-subunit amino acid transport system permease subunit